MSRVPTRPQSHGDGDMPSTRVDALFYYFSCTSDWEVVGDLDCELIDEAMRFAAQHANGETLNWVSP